MNNKEVHCPDCLGTGQDDPPPGHYHSICERCNGTGKVKATPELLAKHLRQSAIVKDQPIR